MSPVATTETSDQVENVGERSGGMKGGHDPRELAQLSAAARRSKKAQAEARKELDRLSVRDRLAHELEARKSDLGEVVGALLDKGKKGDAQAVYALVRLLDQALGRPTDVAPRDPFDEAKPWAQLTREEQATLLHNLRSDIKDAEESAQTSDPT